MPIQHAIWQVGQQPTPLTTAKLASEQQLEDLIVREPAILSRHRGHPRRRTAPRLHPGTLHREMLGSLRARLRALPAGGGAAGL